jgi:hypothetical protein
MTDKQRFLIYVKLGYLIADVRKKDGVGVRDAVETLLETGVIGKLENLETGYYLESGAYLSEVFKLA